MGQVPTGWIFPSFIPDRESPPPTWVWEMRAPSLAVSRARLDGAGSTLLPWEVALELGDLQVLGMALTELLFPSLSFLFPAGLHLLLE